MSYTEITELFDFKDFDNIIINVAEDYLILKTNVKTEADFERWKNTYCEKFKTSLNVAFTYNIKKATLHRRYKCIFGEKRHKGKRKTFLGCPFTLNVKIKLITEKELKKDKELQDYPCFITIQGKHKNCTESVNALKQLRVLPETREAFMRYFSMGMNPPQAARFHEKKLGLNSAMIANASINPTLRAVEHLHQCWIEEHHDSVGEVTNCIDVSEQPPTRPCSEILEEMKDVMLKFYEKCEDENYLVGLEKMLKKMKSAETINQMRSWVFTFGSSATVSKRPRGMSRGAARLGKGCKRKMGSVNEPAKQPRSLANNVVLDQPNDKSHG